jgi:hypothetical protein
MTIYLYKKTHRETGLQYLGKTISADPYSYPGSGVYWTRHLEMHGNNVETEILRECQTEEEIKEWGQYYSKFWNVVEDKNWANLIEEAGPGGDKNRGKTWKLVDGKRVWVEKEIT